MRLYTPGSERTPTHWDAFGEASWFVYHVVVKHGSNYDKIQLKCSKFTKAFRTDESLYQCRSLFFGYDDPSAIKHANSCLLHSKQNL